MSLAPGGEWLLSPGWVGSGCGGALPGLGPDPGFVLQRAKWQCRVILRGEQGHPWSRFGAALTALGDVNGDRLTDVAIGAPGEQDNRGAVYLFHGTSELGISPSHSQVRAPCFHLSCSPPFPILDLPDATSHHHLSCDHSPPPFSGLFP